MSDQFVPGRKTFTYLSTIFDTPVWQEIARRRDTNFNQGKQEGDASAADLDHEATGYGLRTKELTFDYLYKRGTDAIFTALEDSCDNDTVLYFLRLDDALGQSGAKGYKFPGIVAEFNETAALSEGVVYSVTVKFARHEDSGSLVQGERHVEA